jgi:hypothetical protein
VRNVVTVSVASSAAFAPRLARETLVCTVSLISLSSRIRLLES